MNEVPASILLMLTRAVEFRAGSGLGDLKIGSLDGTLRTRLLRHRRDPQRNCQHRPQLGLQTGDFRG